MSALMSALSPSPPPLKGGGGLAGASPERAHQRASHAPGRPKTNENPQPPTLPRADPNCPACDGTGWQFLDNGDAVVCRCRGPEAVAFIRGQQRRAEASWGSPRPSLSGPPAKTDYAEVWRNITRQTLNGNPPPPTPGDAAILPFPSPPEAS